MKVNVRSALSISKIMSGSRVLVELDEPSSLGGLLQELTGMYGQAFYDAVCSGDHDGCGYPADRVAILVNGSSAAAAGGAGTQLKDGDDVLILPVICGG
jgi:molybdopterin converting factor small subunit